MKPVIRELRPGDMDAYVDLCAARMDRKAAEKRAELVEWMAFHNPDHDNKPTYFVIDDGGRLMGHLGRMPTVFHMGGTYHLASYIHDLYIRDEVVKKGQAFFLAMRMYRDAEAASASFCALIWTNEINIRLQKTRKYHQMWAERYVKLLRAHGHIDRRVPNPQLAAPLKPVAAAALHIADRVLATALGARRELVEIDRFDERFDRFAERLKGRLGVCPVKNHRYLNWKYTDRKDIATTHYAALDATGQLTGFVVLTVPSSKHRDSYILELVADPEDEKTISVLVNQAIEHCRKAGAYTVQCMGADPRIAAVLKRFLFVQRPPLEPLFLANPDRSGNARLLQSKANWHFSFGDSEGQV